LRVSMNKALSKHVRSRGRSTTTTARLYLQVPAIQSRDGNANTLTPLSTRLALAARVSSRTNGQYRAHMYTTTYLQARKLTGRLGRSGRLYITRAVIRA